MVHQLCTAYDYRVLCNVIESNVTKCQICLLLQQWTGLLYRRQALLSMGVLII